MLVVCAHCHDLKMKGPFSRLNYLVRGVIITYKSLMLI